jgi:hypothetical protein
MLKISMKDFFENVKPSRHDFARISECILMIHRKSFSVRLSRLFAEELYRIARQFKAPEDNSAFLYPADASTARLRSSCSPFSHVSAEPRARFFLAVARLRSSSCAEPPFSFWRPQLWF